MKQYLVIGVEEGLTVTTGWNLSVRVYPTTSPQSGSKSSFSRSRVCTAGRRILANSGTNQGNGQRRFDPILLAGGTPIQKHGCVLRLVGRQVVNPQSTNL